MGSLQSVLCGDGLTPSRIVLLGNVAPPEPAALLDNVAEPLTAHDFLDSQFHPDLPAGWYRAANDGSGMAGSDERRMR